MIHSPNLLQNRSLIPILIMPLGAGIRVGTFGSICQQVILYIPPSLIGGQTGSKGEVKTVKISPYSEASQKKMTSDTRHTLIDFEKL